MTYDLTDLLFETMKGVSSRFHSLEMKLASSMNLSGFLLLEGCTKVKLIYAFSAFTTSFSADLKDSSNACE